MADTASYVSTMPAAAGGGPSLRDFSDRLSPMIVKELRQGLRSPVFIWMFIIMHVALMMVVLLTTTEGNRYTGVWFWIPIIITLVYLLPLRGLGSLLDEKRLNTLDSLVLTKLTASRITLGKWAALAAQIMLLGLTVFPYMIMRYFAGAINVMVELRFLCHFLLLGCLFAAVTVSISWIKMWLVRGVLVTVVGLMAGRLAVSMMEVMSFDSRLPEWKTELRMTALAWFLAIFAIYYLLDYAAAQIAPRAENRSSTRRVVTLVVLGILGGTLLLTTDGRYLDVAGIFALMIAIFAGLDAVTEPTQHLSIITLPFVKRGWLGKCAGRLLYPGWHTGLVFMLLISLVGAAASVYADGFKFNASILSSEVFIRFAGNFLIWLGKVLFGLLIVHALLPRLQPTLLALLLVLVTGQLMGYLLWTAAEEWRMPLLGVLNHFTPLSAMFDRDIDRAGELILPGIQALVFLLLLGMRAAREFAITRRMEAQAEADLADEKKSHPPVPA